jgi:hypothetical protein
MEIKSLVQMAILVCVPSVSMRAADTPAVVELQPFRELSLNRIAGSSLPADANLKDIRADSTTLWLLVYSKGSAAFSVLRINLDGTLRTRIMLGPDVKAAAIAPTARGIAVAFSRKTGSYLQEYDRQGTPLPEIRVPCASMQQLLSINGNASTICLDGLLTQYPPSSNSIRYSSWARLGTRVEVLSNNQLAIVDRQTGQVLLNDLDSGHLSPVTTTVPEIDSALEEYASVAQQARQSLAAGAPPLGGSVVVMGTAHDQTGLYLLIYPYNDKLGPALVKLSNAGALAARYRCRLQSPKGSFQSIEIQDGVLVLGSSAGQMLLYRLPE